jgi:aldose 1-epimerase
MDYGITPDGTPVSLHELTNGRLTARVISFGAIVTELHVPDRHGRTADVVLGFDTLADYVGSNRPHFGAAIGRVANRVAGGKFSLDGREYTLAVNNGPNSLHGGKKGFDKVVWTARDVQGSTVALSYLSPDGEEGYPGNLSVTVTYTLTPDDALAIEYTATTDRPTPVNLTNHSYFNLAGHGAGDVLGHEVMIAADVYTPFDPTQIPTGAIEPVRGTPLDFTTPAPVGARLAEVGGVPAGYDHNYVLRGGPDSPGLAARVRDPGTGRVMEMLTTEPGVQLYTGNHLDGSIVGKGGVRYRQYQGLCLEAQHYPDSVHHPSFPSIILRPGETYRQTTVYRFSNGD